MNPSASSSRYVEHIDDAFVDKKSNETFTQFDMFRALVEFWIVGKRMVTIIIMIQFDRTGV